MNDIMPWDPFHELEEVHNHLTTLFDRGFNRRHNGREESLMSATWSPLVDIEEDEKHYTIKVELPEMKREDIKVGVENGVLTISGERKLEHEEKNKKYHRVERSEGSFMRRFTLPQDVEAGRVAARYHDGLLTVEVAKSPKARPQSIEVKAD